MELDLWIDVRRSIDFGLMVLLWLVQWVVYPAFLRMEREQLLVWHAQYTRRMGYLVGPLMLAQLALSLWLLWQQPGWGRGLDLALVLSCWALTAGVSVPLHQQIAGGACDAALLRRLVVTNWPRTLLWTAICGLGWTLN